jgi:vancomycin resistance protein VanJ
MFGSSKGWLRWVQAFRRSEPRPAARKRSRLGRWLMLAGALWGTIINLFLIFHWICLDCVTPTAQLNYLAHILTAIALLGAGMALVLRAPLRLVGWLLVGGVAFMGWFGPEWLPKQGAAANGPTFTVLSYNVYGRSADPDELIRVIREADADIVGIQEMNESLTERLEASLSDLYPHQKVQVIVGHQGYALLSRFPILETDTDFVPEPGETIVRPEYLRGEVEIEGQRVAVYVLHLEVPLYKALVKLDQAKNVQQARLVAEEVRQDTLPVVALCDCNTALLARGYRILDEVLEDTHRAIGWGFGLTHPTRPFPFLRIDYVWYGAGIQPVDIKVWPDGGTSDHFPVMARLAVEGSP